MVNPITVYLAYMGINFDNGEISPKPHVIAEEERFKFASDLKHGDVLYTEMTSWFADAKDQMWLSATASMLTENDIYTMDMSDECMTKEGEMIDEDHMCRAICLDIQDKDSGEIIRGFIIDCSVDDFTYGGNDAENKLTRMSIAYNSVEHAAMDGYLPIFGWIRNEAELEACEPILKNYGIKLEVSVLESMSDDEQD